MSEMTFKERAGDFLASSKVKIAGLVASGTMLVASASATVDINGTVGPILDSVTALIPTIINLIVAIVPAIIVMAIVGFIVTFFDKILAMMKL